MRIDAIIKTLRNSYGSTMLARVSKKHDAFCSLIATVLSARARDETTEVVVEGLFRKYGTPEQLANASLKDVEVLVKKSGFYRVKAKRIIDVSKELLSQFDGIVPSSMEELTSLPGVGRKTAGCVLVYAFNKPAIPVDTHVHRVSNRLGLVHTKQPEKTEQELMKIVPKKYWKYVNDLFVYHGKNVCKPIRPVCSECKITKWCDYYDKIYSQQEHR